MEAIPHDIMGYDRAITVFSPDGRLLQVEYARKTVSQGTIAIGITCKDGVILLSDKRIIEKLIVPESVEKIFQIDKHIGVSVSGLISDGRVLVEKLQSKAQSHRITYDEPIEVSTLAKDIADQKQMFTQYGGARPYGVSLLIAGIDDKGPKLFMTEPSGILFGYKATSMGDGSNVVNKFLNDNYKDSLDINKGIKLGLEGLKAALGKKFSKDRVDIAVIKSDDKLYKKLTRSEIDKYLKGK